MNADQKPTYFSTPAAFRAWLMKHHRGKKELVVGFFKKDSGKPSITWPESVDEALCFGWIDGIRRSIDSERYSIRFTPRKPTSNWSKINLQKMNVLIAAGRMTPAGLTVYEQRDLRKAGVYAYEREPLGLVAAYKKSFRSNRSAWEFFSSMPPSYQKIAAHWVMSAQRKTTQEARLAALIKDSEAGLRVRPLRIRKAEYRKPG